MGSPEHIEDMACCNVPREAAAPSSNPDNNGVARLQDSPKPWLQDLVRQLRPDAKHALFCTCKALADMVVHFSPGLTLQPARALQEDASRRAAALSLAAGCKNVHLHLQGYSMDIDHKDTWQSITQLTLSNVALSQEVCSRLHLQQLTKLHTMQLTRLTSKCVVTSDVNALQNVAGAGGLKQLHCMHIISDEGAAVAHMQQRLAPILGLQVTHLTLQGLASVTQLRQWGCLQHLTVTAGKISWMWEAFTKEVAGELYRHHTLRHVTLPPLGNWDETNQKDATCNLEHLELVGTVFTDFLALLPRTIKRVSVHARFMFRPPWGELIDTPGIPMQEQACVKANVDYLPVVGDWFMLRLGLPKDMPVFVLQGTYHPLLLAKCTERLQGVLMLQNATTHVEHLHAPALAHISPGVHTLVLHSVPMHDTEAWNQLIKHLPAHITHLMVANCSSKKQDFLQLFEQPPPTSLKRFTLRKAPWLMPHNVDEVHKLAKQGWPSIMFVTHL